VPRARGEEQMTDIPSPDPTPPSNEAGKVPVLLPCPFCGCHGERIPNYRHLARCSNDNQCPMQNCSMSVDQWQDRAPAPPGPPVWQPISEYRDDMGAVLVWLEWPSYSQITQGLERNGAPYMAYRISITDGAPIWVGQSDCIPIETTGRKVSAFWKVTAP
jgi:hypothetical protein